MANAALTNHAVNMLPKLVKAYETILKKHLITEAAAVARAYRVTSAQGMELTEQAEWYREGLAILAEANSVEVRSH